MKAIVVGGGIMGLGAAWALQRDGHAVTVLEQASGGLYAVPPVDGTGLKIGDHGFSMQGHPDRDRSASDADVATTLGLAGTRLRDFAHYRVIEAGPASTASARASASSSRRATGSGSSPASPATASSSAR